MGVAAVEKKKHVAYRFSPQARCCCRLRAADSQLDTRHSQV